MHSPFRHRALPQTTTPWLAAQATTWQMIGRYPVHISLTASTRFGGRFGAFFWTECFENNVPLNNTTPIYLINLLWKLGLEI